MPLSTDEKMLDLSRKVIEGFDRAAGGIHPGFRPGHAKGILVKGEFRPSKEAATLTRAPHVQRESTPVTVRLSDSGGIPTVADNNPQAASPRGCATRFHLAEHEHTDIVAHSVDSFPMRTAEGFLDFLNAVLSTDPNGPHPNAIEQFLGANPSALAFIQAPKPIPVSLAQESYFAVSAFKFINAKGESRFGRYRILPKAGNAYVAEADLPGKSANFLFDEIRERIAKGPIGFRIVVQLAEDGDVTDDATVRWPETRAQVEFGEITLHSFTEHDGEEQQKLIFDPIPRVDGIEPSADPLFEPRANVYLMSGRRRRSAEK